MEFTHRYILQTRMFDSYSSNLLHVLKISKIYLIFVLSLRILLCFKARMNTLCVGVFSFSFIFDQLKQIVINNNGVICCYCLQFVGRLYCNATYDGVQCWNHTLAGTTAIGACPEGHPASAFFDNPTGKFISSKKFLWDDQNKV